MEVPTVRLCNHNYKVILYGYRGQRWLKLDDYYFKVIKGFKLSDITDIKVKWRDPFYCEDCIGYTLCTKDNWYDPYTHKRDIMYESNPSLYALVDKLMDMATDLNIPFVLPSDYTYDSDDSDDNEDDNPNAITITNTDDIMALCDKVVAAVNDNQRLLGILNTGSILTLAKSVDTHQQSIETVEQKLNDVKIRQTALSDTLKLKTQEAEEYKKIIKELQAENASLKQEKVTIKKDIIEKLRETISHM